MQVLAPNSPRQILENAIAQRIFPGTYLHAETAGRVLMHETCGHTDYSQQTTVDENTIYDLASLSKLWILAAWLQIADEFDISPSRSVGDFLPAFATSDKRDITLRQLLQHSSGIGLAIQNFTDQRALQVLAEMPELGWNPNAALSIPRHEWTRILAAAPLHSAPGSAVFYSCSNYFLLARVLAKIIGGKLSYFLVERLFWPLFAPKIWQSRTTLWPRKYLQPPEHHQIAPTEIDASGQALRGVVHDEAARAWFARGENNFCGNAGIFSNGEGVLRFARLWLHAGAHENRQILPPHLVEQSFADTIVETQTSDVLTKRAWCWQIDAPLYMSADAPRGSAGHAGFTGPTLWLHRPTQTLCILLNNRVHPTRNGPNRFPAHRQIAQMVIEAL